MEIKQCTKAYLMALMITISIHIVPMAAMEKEEVNSSTTTLNPLPSTTNKQNNENAIKPDVNITHVLPAITGNLLDTNSTNSTDLGNDNPRLPIPFFPGTYPSNTSFTNTSKTSSVKSTDVPTKPSTKIIELSTVKLTDVPTKPSTKIIELPTTIVLTTSTTSSTKPPPTTLSTKKSTISTQSSTTTASNTVTPESILTTTKLEHELINTSSASENISTPSTKGPSVVLTTNISPKATSFKSTSSTLRTTVKHPTSDSITIDGNFTRTGANSTEPMYYSDKEFYSSDSFWPIAMALTIGLPTIIVFGVTIAVLHKRRTAKPRSLLAMYGQEYS